MTLESSFYRRKVAQIQAGLAEEGLEGLLLLDPYNVYYAVGFFHIPTERPLAAYIPADGDPALFLPLLELDHANEGWVQDIKTYFEYPGVVHPVAWMCREIPVERLAVDSTSHNTFLHIQAEKENVVFSDLIYRMRQRKDAEEIELIARAATYADFAVKTARRVAIAGAAEGITEREIRDETMSVVVARMRAQMAESIHNWARHSCGGTVHLGERAAFPHGLPGGRRVRSGDSMIVGFGAAVGGYHAESGCTFVVGKPSSEQNKWLETAMLIREVVKEEIKPGALCCDVNRKGLDVVKKAGLGMYIKHRLGHGIGLQNHESPWIESGDSTVLAPGMVVSNEPGIYVPGHGGVRIIDTFLVTEEGNRLLSQYLANVKVEDCVVPV